MKSFDNYPDTKARCLKHVRAFGSLELAFGIPRELCVIALKIGGHVAAFPEKFIEAIPVGADLSMVWPKFAHWLLMDPEHGVHRFPTGDRSRTAIQSVGDLYARWIAGESPTKEAWRPAWDAAWRARTTAAETAGWAAGYIVDGSGLQAVHATTAAAAATLSADARKQQAEKLIELLKEAR